MRKNKAVKKHGFRFLSGVSTCCFAVLAVISYCIGAACFGYYSDLNPLLPLLTLAAVAGCMASAFLADKKGDKTIYSLLTLVVTVILAVCVAVIAGARVYSFAVLLLSDLERDNIEGYYALYCSIGAMGLYMLGIFSNIVTSFTHGYVVSGVEA